MPFPFLVSLLLGFGSLVIGYLLMPKPKQQKPPSVDDLESPTSEAGRPIPVPMGSIEIVGLNLLYAGDKSIITRTVSNGGKK